MSKSKLPSKFLVINVDSDFIKICNVGKRKDQITVYNAVTIKTPEFSYEDGVLKDLPNIVKAIHEALKTEKIKTRDVVFSISSTKVLSKEVTLPYITSDSKILSLIKANAGEYFPVATEDCVYAYSILNTFEVEVDGKKQKQMKFIAYAVVNDIVNSRYELAKQLDLKVVSVDYTGNSIAQLSKLQINEESTMTMVIKDESTVISAFTDKTLTMQRTVLVGASVIINAVAAAYSVTYEGAKEMMSTTNINEIIEAKPSVKDEIDEYFTSIQRIKEYYRRSFADNPLAKICIMGEGADYAGFEELFSSYLMIPTRQITSLNGVTVAMAEQKEKNLIAADEGSSVLSVSHSDPSREMIKYIEVLGAAIDPLGLVSKELEGQVRDKSRNTYYRLIVLCAVFIAIALVGIPYIKYTDTKSTNEELTVKRDNLKEENKVVYEKRDESNKIDDMYADLVTFDKNTFVAANYSYEFVEALEAALPKDCVLSSLRIAEDGTASMSLEADTLVTLIKYIMQMKSISNVDDEWVQSATTIKKGITADGQETSDQTQEDGTVSRISIEATCKLLPGNVFYLNSDKTEAENAAKNSKKK